MILMSACFLYISDIRVPCFGCFSRCCELWQEPTNSAHFDMSKETYFFWTNTHTSCSRHSFTMGLTIKLPTISLP